MSESSFSKGILHGFKVATTFCENELIYDEEGIISRMLTHLDELKKEMGDQMTDKTPSAQMRSAEEWHNELREVLKGCGETIEPDAFDLIQRIQADALVSRSQSVFKCQASDSVGDNCPQERNYPLCDCDPNVEKIIAAFQECGYELKPVSQSVDDDEVHTVIQEILNHITCINTTPTSRQETFNLQGMMQTVRRILTRAGSSGDDRTLPELPDGWNLIQLGLMATNDWQARICGPKMNDDILQTGPTPREAVEAAIRKIKS